MVVAVAVHTLVKTSPPATVRAIESRVAVALRSDADAIWMCAVLRTANHGAVVANVAFVTLARTVNAVSVARARGWAGPDLTR